MRREKKGKKKESNTETWERRESEEENKTKATFENIFFPFSFDFMQRQYPDKA